MVRLVVFGICVVGLTASACSAAFVNGVERFDGTAKDLVTWEQYGATFTQSDALTISGFGNYADYTTRAVTVAIGQRVTAEVTLTAPDAPLSTFEAGLLLTTNSKGTTSDTFADSRFFGPQIRFDTATQNPGAYFQSIDGANGGYGAADFGAGIPVSGTTYLLSVARSSVSQVSISASFLDGTLIFDDTFTAFDPIPSTGLSISLHRTNLGGFLSSATFDDVTITNIPEPRLGLFLFAGPSVLWRLTSSKKMKTKHCRQSV